MSQTICANCGKPKPMATNQAPREAKWPTYWADILYELRKMREFREHIAKGGPIRPGPGAGPAAGRRTRGGGGRRASEGQLGGGPPPAGVGPPPPAGVGL